MSNGNDKERELLARAGQCFRSGRPAEAQALARQVLQRDPGNPGALELLAYVAGNAGDERGAHDLLLQASRRAECAPEALYYLGASSLRRGEFAQALAVLRRAVDLEPRFFEAWHDLGSAQASLGDKAAAHESFTRAATLNPRSFELFFNLGRLGSDLGRFEEALANYSRSIDLNAGFAEAWLNKGLVLHRLRRFDEALMHVEQAIRLQPALAAAWSAKGFILNDMHHYAEALQQHDRALALDPSHAEAWLNKGVTLDHLERHVEAVAHYERALELAPGLDYLPGNLMHARLSICDWTGVDTLRERLLTGIQSGKRVCSPFVCLALTDDPGAQLATARLYAADRFPATDAAAPIARAAGRERLRVGYFSADLKNHPVGLVAAGLFELHDRSRFETFAFSLAPAGVNDPVRPRLEAAFDHFLAVQDRTDAEIARQARELGIDVAVDLGGYTLDARPGIFARRVAPVQVSYLGFAGTMGMSCYDYLLADATVVPASEEAHYDECIVRLPGCFMVDDAGRGPSDTVFSRAECGLPESGLVFCCFNRGFKITPEVFGAWMRVLQRVPGSVLWLAGSSEVVRENLRQAAQAAAVDPQRLVFAARVRSGADHLARQRLADLFLDTSPYNAHVTALDALRAGLPVLTLAGRSFASRVGASLLGAAGLPELVTHSLADYEALAVGLAQDAARLSALRARLVANLPGCPLFDTARSTRHLESAYAQMHRRWQSGLAPVPLAIGEEG